jgi:hypothetical protein
MGCAAASLLEGSWHLHQTLCRQGWTSCHRLLAKNPGKALSSQAVLAASHKSATQLLQALASGLAAAT